MGREMQAGLVLVNGKILSVDHASTVVEAVAVNGEWISERGSSSEMKQFIGEEMRTQASGRDCSALFARLRRPPFGPGVGQ
jgi:predicted amidohydrolase YtcJ